MGTDAGASLTTLLAWRYIPGAALLALAARRVRGPRVTDRRGVIEAIVVGGLGQALVTYTTLSALRWISAATLGFLFYTYPAWVAALAALRGTERVGRASVVAIALSLAGIALIAGAPQGNASGPTWPGVLFALAGALSYSLYVPYLHRIEARSSPAAASAYVTGGAGVVFLLAALVDGSFTLRLAPQALGAALTLAVACTFVAFLTLLRGLATLGPVRASIVSTIEPFWTAVLAAAVLAQPITARTLVGGALIAAAVMIVHARR